MQRRGFAVLPLALAALFVAEVAVFLAVAHAIGGGWALLLLAAFTVAGMALLRREGARGWRAFRAAADQGRPPGPEVTNSLVGLGGALLLAFPGFLTSLAGLLMLVPPLRGFARRGVESFAARRIDPMVAGDLFGPRRVKVRRGDPVEVVVEPEPADRAPERAAAIEGEVIEGEVLR
ncbi:FxsA family protein [Actinoplanes sp. KI2]|uniref:FxsA family protein n=1 Tax=Actinoplanes sp. KI2 TaxID=2983315 RepID=UPI0021D56F76|nr:FxsA family protein [Actinoplanes sp. KI2]MCU7722577.1 FxsA family protein [Actinoplanes sp. KI2]